MSGETVHASCVAFGDIGVLLRGPPGSGKSDLALRLIEAGAVLVADDRVRLARHGARLVAAAPDRLAGLLEVRGIGIVALPARKSAQVRLVADLVASGTPERLPDPAWCEYLECRIRRVAIVPFEQSAPVKLRLAAHDAAGQADPVTGARPHGVDPERTAR